MPKTRKQIARKEATRDPIFVFQTSRLIITDTYEIDYCLDCGEYTEVAAGHTCATGHGALTEEELIDHEWAERVWQTRRVFLTREEGEAWGEAREHRFGEKGKGWRVYCVPAEGELAGLLRQNKEQASKTIISVRETPCSNTVFVPIVPEFWIRQHNR